MTTKPKKLVALLCVGTCPYQKWGHPLKGTCQEKTLLPKKNIISPQVLLNQVPSILTIAEISLSGVSLHCTSHPSG
jgi:hypothetical protein